MLKSFSPESQKRSEIEILLDPKTILEKAKKSYLKVFQIRKN